MTRFNRSLELPASAAALLPPMLRAPRRVTITLSWAVHEQLCQRSLYEGRSLSNLAAHLLESSLGIR